MQGPNQSESSFCKMLLRKLQLQFSQIVKDGTIEVAVYS